MGKDTEVTYSDLFDKIAAGQVQDATIQGTELHGHLKASPKDQFHTTISRALDDLAKELHASTRSTSPSRIRRTTSCFPC